MNGAELTKASVKKLQEAEADPLFTPVLPLLSNERKSLIRALRSTRNGPDYTLIDCLRESQAGGKFNPVTFADVVVDSNGKETPLNPELFAAKDYSTKQSLDYIFALEPTEASKSTSGQNSGKNMATNPEKEEEQDKSSAKVSRKPRVNVQETRVVKFLITDKTVPCGQCSDHFGVSTVIE